MTRYNTILATLETKLNDWFGDTALVTRSRKAAFDRQDGDCISIAPVTIKHSDHSTGFDLNILNVELQIMTRAEIPDLATNDLVENLFTNLFADVTLDGTCLDIRLDDTVSFDDVSADGGGGWQTFPFDFHYLAPKTEV